MILSDHPITKIGDWVIGQFQGKANIRTFRALSYSSALLAHWGDDPCVWQVSSSHPHACNLSTRQGELFALVSPQHGNGPFHVVLPQAALAQISHTEQFVASHAQLKSAALSIQLQGAQVWSPRLPTLPRPMMTRDSIALLQPYHHQLTQLLNEAALAHWHLLECLDRGGKQIMTGLHLGDYKLVTKGVAELVGLGPGLTPLGDDFLVGILGGLHLVAPSGFSAEISSALQQGMMKRSTTRLSLLWLRHALCGEFGEAWHQLNAALLTASASAIHLAFTRIAASGATSGVAALSGLCLCWEYLADQGMFLLDGHS